MERVLRVQTVKLDGPGFSSISLKFGVDTVVSSDDVRVLGLGVTLSSDLTVDKHVSKVCLATATCPAITIDSESAATLVHARPFTLCSVPSRRNPLTKGRYQAVPVSTDLRFVVDRSAFFQVRVSGKSTASQQVIRPEN